jgi:hypothetical protein
MNSGRKPDALPARTMTPGEFLREQDDPRMKTWNVLEALAVSHVPTKPVPAIKCLALDSAIHAFHMKFQILNFKLSCALAAGLAEMSECAAGLYF